jgi:ATP-binding cassette, subfamily C, bacterial LapB
MMDPHTEQMLIASLKKNLPDTTILLITHRMAMLPLVDRLVVMEQGKIAADGAIADVLRRLGGNAEGGAREAKVATS